MRQPRRNRGLGNGLWIGTGLTGLILSLSVGVAPGLPFLTTASADPDPPAPSEEFCRSQGHETGRREGRNDGYRGTGAVLGEGGATDIDALRRALDRANLLSVEAVSRRRCEESGHRQTWEAGFREGYGEGFQIGMRERDPVTPMITDGLGNPRTMEVAPGEGKGEPINAAGNLR
ncbi:MAG: hypothetical protein IT285_15425 [Bdellovibrionales bacterium]|nr:hypothetical protein [Bdellovibrionales bacterium]